MTAACGGIGPPAAVLLAEPHFGGAHGVMSRECAKMRAVLCIKGLVFNL